jgi:Na+/alanine symporter
MVGTWSLSLPVHDIERVTKLLRYRSSLPKGVECEFHKTHLSNSHTSLTGLNEFLSVLLTFGGLGSIVGIATAYGLDGPGIESQWG